MLKKFLNLGKSMKLKKKPIESIRVRKDRAKKLKDISLELSFEFGGYDFRSRSRQLPNRHPG